MSRNIRVIALLLISITILTGCGGNIPSITWGSGSGDMSAGGGPWVWNFLVYMAADNNLDNAALKDLIEMELVGSTADINILVLYDGDDSGDSRFCRIVQDSDREIIQSPWVSWDECAMDDPNTLSTFLTYCHTYYPAQHTVLTLWGHGSAVYPRTQQVTDRVPRSAIQIRDGSVTSVRGVCYDDTSGLSSWYCLTTDEVRQALDDYYWETGQRIDVINMDTCMMQLLEVAYEWRSYADYLTGSQDSVPNTGTDYTAVLSDLTLDPTMTPREFSIMLVDEFYLCYNGRDDSTYSALDLGTPLDELMTSFASLASALYGTEYMGEVYEAWKYASWWSYVYQELTDLTDFATNLASSEYVPSDTVVRSAAASVLDDLPSLIVHHRETGSNVNYGYGLSVLSPSHIEWPEYADEYPKLLLPLDTDWDEFIQAFVAYTAALPT